MSKVLGKLLNFLYPRCCPLCHQILKDQRAMICENCSVSLKPIRQPYCKKCGRPVDEEEEYCKDCMSEKHQFEEGRGIFLYQGKMKESLIKYKYYGHREYGAFYAAAICRYAEKEIRRWRPELIVPVPLHKKKKRARGFNQAGDLAEKIGAYFGIPVFSELVSKKEHTKSQKKLNAAARKRNLKGVFSVTERLDGRRVLVIDDVYTTGSTMDAIASALKEKGAERVYFLAVCIGQNI